MTHRSASTRRSRSRRRVPASWSTSWRGCAAQTAARGIASRRSSRCASSCSKRPTRCSTRSTAAITTALRGEIGDFLFEGVFLAQIAADDGHFTVADSLRAISEKLVRRHPHVFGDRRRRRHARRRSSSSGRQIKAREQTDAGETRSLLSGAAEGAAVAAARVRDRHARRRGRLRLGADRRRGRQDRGGGRRAAAARSQHERPRRAPRKRWATCSSRSPTCRASWASSRSRRCGRPTTSSRRASTRWSGAFAARGRSVHDATLEEMEAEWQQVKAHE